MTTRRPLINDGGQIRNLSPVDELQLSLDQLSDVDTAGATDGDALVYDANSPMGWRAGAPDLGDRVVELLVSDPQGSAITTGDGQVYFRVPALLNGMDLVGVAAAVSTVSTSGLPTMQLARIRSGSPADMLSTALTIDANETDSSTATTPALIDTANNDVATADMIRVDVDVAGTGTKGLIVEMTFRFP